MGVEWYENILLVTSITNDKIYKVDPTNGEVISSFDSPGSGPMDFAQDGNYLWNADYEDDKIFKIDKATETAIETYDSPGEHPIGLAWDGTYLWHSDYNFIKIYFNYLKIYLLFIASNIF